MLKIVEMSELNLAKLSGVATNGAPSMTGGINWFTTKFLAAIRAENVVVSHCIIYQENLCTKLLDFTENHRQFKAFLDELDSEYPDVLHFHAEHYISGAATLKRFWNLRMEINFFMENKHQNVDFLSDENWLNDLAFLIDITQHLSDPNLGLLLRTKNQLVNKLFENIYAFEKKLELCFSWVEPHWPTSCVL